MISATQQRSQTVRNDLHTQVLHSKAGKLRKLVLIFADAKVGYTEGPGRINLLGEHSSLK
jgi:galactokinase